MIVYNVYNIIQYKCLCVCSDVNGCVFQIFPVLHYLFLDVILFTVVMCLI